MRKTKLLCLLLCLFIAVPYFTANATVISDYEQKMPAASSQINGISLTKIADGAGGGIMLEQYALSTRELASAKYFAIKYYNPNNAAWPIYFICQQNGGFVYMSEGASYTLTNENFEPVSGGTVQYSALAPAVSGTGYIIIPASAFSGLATVDALYITLPATSAAGVSYHFEKLLYTTADSSENLSDFTVLTDFSLWTEAWFAGRETNASDIKCGLVKAEKDIIGITVDGLLNGVSVTQVAFGGAYNEGGLMVNSFLGDNPAVMDITTAKYLAFEIANPSSVDMASLIKLQDNAGNQATVTTGAEIEIFNKDFTSSRKAVCDPYVRLKSGESGWAVIPISAFSGLNGTIVAVYYLIPSYAAELNGSSVQFGRIAVYQSENITDYLSGEVVADPFSWAYGDYTARIASTTTETIVSIARAVYKTPQIIPITCDFGDVRILEDLDTNYPETEEEYNAVLKNKIYDKVGGLSLSRYTSDELRGSAMKVDVIEPKADRPDDYAGITFTAKASVNKWSQWVNDEGEIEGVTFFVKNLSLSEISMCFEIDEYDPEQDIAANPAGERWSIGLGGRIILKDALTGKESVVNATPTFNIPCGFTGWVRIPVNCFSKPAWCSWGNSVLDLVKVPQFTIAINTVQNIGASFVLDDFGLYYNKTNVSSMFFNIGHTIGDNLKSEG